MPNAQSLYREGKLDQAIEALGAEVRDNPTDAKRRTFLFELLCFAGQYERAEKQLGVLGKGSKEAEMGGLLYHSALHAERLRQTMFDGGSLPDGPPPRAVAGTLNGERFESLVDADSRIGARLELFAAGQYMWLPLEQVATVRMESPKRLRDLLWAPAIVRTADSFQGMELGEVLIPALAPLTWRSGDDAVRLGRITQWDAGSDTDAPIGQKIYLVDGEEMPVLEIRELVIDETRTGE
jgi:type VI secretion system protein ImpE